MFEEFIGVYTNAQYYDWGKDQGTQGHVVGKVVQCRIEAQDGNYPIWPSTKQLSAFEVERERRSSQDVLELSTHTFHAFGTAKQSASQPCSQFHAARRSLSAERVAFAARTIRAPLALPHYPLTLHHKAANLSSPHTPSTSPTPYAIARISPIHRSPVYSSAGRVQSTPEAIRAPGPDPAGCSPPCRYPSMSWTPRFAPSMRAAARRYLIHAVLGFLNIH